MFGLRSTRHLCGSAPPRPVHAMATARQDTAAEAAQLRRMLFACRDGPGAAQQVREGAVPVALESLKRHLGDCGGACLASHGELLVLALDLLVALGNSGEALGQVKSDGAQLDARALQVAGGSIAIKLAACRCLRCLCQHPQAQQAAEHAGVLPVRRPAVDLRLLSANR